MSSTANLDLVVVGSIGIDNIETPWQTRTNLLGGSASYACAAASFFANVGMVGVVGDDFPEEFRSLYRSFSFDLDGLQTQPGRTFNWTGIYEESMDNRRTVETVLGVFEHFQPDLPVNYCNSPYLFLGNMAPALQLHVLKQMKAPEFVLVDTMDLWINIAREELVEVISKVHALTINESEARLLTDRHHLLDAAHVLLDMGPEMILVKKGEHGSMLVTKERLFLQPAFPLRSVTDPTGAGDTFAGALMGYLAGEGDPSDAAVRRAMVRGSVVASFGVETFSLERLAKLDRNEIDRRAESLLAMMSV